MPAYDSGKLVCPAPYDRVGGKLKIGENRQKNSEKQTRKPAKTDRKPSKKCHYWPYIFQIFKKSLKCL